VLALEELKVKDMLPLHWLQAVVFTGVGKNVGTAELTLESTATLTTVSAPQPFASWCNLT
jgi:hypothetical protein